MTLKRSDLPDFDLESNLSDWTQEELREHIQQAFNILDRTRPNFVSLFESYLPKLKLRLKFVFDKVARTSQNAKGNTTQPNEFIKIEIDIKDDLPRVSSRLSVNEKESINRIFNVAQIFDNSSDALIAAVIHELGHVFQRIIHESVIDADNPQSTQKKLSEAISEIPCTTQYSDPKFVPSEERIRMYEPWCEGLACEAMIDVIKSKARLSFSLETLTQKLDFVEELMGKCLEEKLEKLKNIALDA
jgi:hypothetical protein